MWPEMYDLYMTFSDECQNLNMYKGSKSHWGSARVINKTGFWFVKQTFDAFLVDLMVHLWFLLREMLLLRECLTLWNRTLSCSVQPVLWGKTACACSSMMKSPLPACLPACLVFKPPWWASIWSSACTGRPAEQPPASNRDPVNVAKLYSCTSDVTLTSHAVIKKKYLCYNDSALFLILSILCFLQRGVREASDLTFGREPSFFSEVVTQI